MPSRSPRRSDWHPTHCLRGHCVTPMPTVPRRPTRRRPTWRPSMRTPDRHRRRRATAAPGRPASRRPSRGRGEPTGLGSGVVVSRDGYILTSAHVLAGSRAGVAAFADGRELPIEIVGRDPSRIWPWPGSTAACWRPPSSAMPIDCGSASWWWWLAPRWVSPGRHRWRGQRPRPFAADPSGCSATRIVENVIQTDAALNPGTPAVRSPMRTAGWSASIPRWPPAVWDWPCRSTPPADESLVPSCATGRFRRAFLGIAGMQRPLPPRVARALGRSAGIGLIEVIPGSPAATAGLREGDLILDVDGQAVADASDLQRLMVGETIGRPPVHSHPARRPVAGRLHHPGGARAQTNRSPANASGLRQAHASLRSPGSNLSRHPKVTGKRRMALIGAAVYLVSPIDLVPGFIPVAGQLDDAAAILIAIGIALRSMQPGADRGPGWRAWWRLISTTTCARSARATRGWVGKA